MQICQMRNPEEFNLNNVIVARPWILLDGVSFPVVTDVNQSVVYCVRCAQWGILGSETAFQFEHVVRRRCVHFIV